MTAFSHDFLRAIHASGRQMTIAVTGGGSAAIAALVQTPGASRSILEAIVPYSHESLAAWLGGAPDQACSDATARAMAMAAFMRSLRLAPDFDARRLVGVGCTASLATDRPKRGAHRVHVAVQTADETASHTLALAKDQLDRADEEQIAGAAVLWALAAACGVDAEGQWQLLTAHRPASAIASRRQRASAAETALLLGKQRCAVVEAGATEVSTMAAGHKLPVIFPGAFNPPHVGHRRMAIEADWRLGQSAAWEISIENVDKPPLDFISLRERLDALRKDAGARPIAVTRAPTFVEKATLFPGATFVVGADTIARIADPRYYCGDAQRCEAAIRHLAEQECRFLVFGRSQGAQFKSLADLELPAPLRRLCIEVPEAEFREDVSSTELRSHDGV